MSNRTIFEEVSSDATQRISPTPGGIDKRRGGARGAIRVWLAMLFLCVVAMIVVGGLTRLTDSGLSITEWRPIAGALPPMTEAHWQEEFEKYQQIDQFQVMNSWMELSDFKKIYWWEWGHRQLGRVVGIIWAVGYLGFLATRSIPAGWYGRLLLPGVLGMAQGAIGWWMVSSGVTQGEGMTSVASYRLATHLGLAFVILGYLTWFFFLLAREERDLMQARRLKEAKLFGMGTGLLHFAFLQILIGALVAGIDAGRSYTDWPLMGGQILPPRPFMIDPIWKNFFENPALVQFVHRVSGYLLFIFTIVVWVRGRRSAHATTRFAFNAVLAAMSVQVAIGIGTVVTAAPVEIAIVHQAVAVLVWVLILRARFLAGYPIPTLIKRH
ncbi:heme A synthase [Phaeobacter sp. B1627]|uniref:heme A synthase n=1 Tax=Phaeobacter sp. B1627 TaxID=2583809 RepID=UPI001118A8A2|nr:heme A synthase [Phaeobacter sp. B1627]TNJ41572.1 heme A synthase [Phaeobacter sp. B1627]